MTRETLIICELCGKEEKSKGGAFGDAWTRLEFDVKAPLGTGHAYFNGDVCAPCKVGFVAGVDEVLSKLRTGE